MLTFLRRLFFGDKKFHPWTIQMHQMHCERLFLRLEASVYRKYRGMFRPAHFHRGTYTIHVAFNPGMDPLLFELVLGMASQADDVRFVPVPFDDLDSVLEAVMHDEEAGGVNWSYQTVLRRAEDLQAIYDWMDEVQASMIQMDHEPITMKEITGFNNAMSGLTEDLSTCQLNS